MIIYYILILLPILLYYLSARFYPKTVCCKIAITVFFAILLFMLVLRSETVGRDVTTYHLYFNGIAKTEWRNLPKVNLEIGYVFINKLIASIGGNYRVLLVVVALITIIPIWLIYYYEGEDAPTEIVIFINMSTFLMFFSGFRQSIAVSLGVIAFMFVKRKKIIFFLLTVAAALLFHNSAFILLLMYPMYHIKLKKKYLPVIIGIILAVFIFNRPIFNFLSSFVSDVHNADKSITNTGAYGMIILLILFVAFSYVIPDEKSLSKEIYGLRNFLLLSLTLQLFAPVNFLAMRMNYYFIIFIPVLISKIVSNPSVKWRQVAVLGKYVIMAVMMFNFFVLVVRQNALDTFPYEFVWQV